MVVGLLVVATVPRLLNRAIKPDKIYPLYGIRYSVHRAIVTLTNNRSFKILFGDSSSIVHYLRYLGYRLPDVEQTGSNFGTHLKHENPYLSSVGSGTMVADGFRSSMPTTPARPFACPERRSDHTTSWGTSSPIRRKARRATTASSRRRP